MNETSKVRERLLPLLRGRGIDVGCGKDPLTSDCDRYDREQGNAQELREPVETYDWLYSSHCLEHMPRPEEALQNWWRLVRPGGLMIIIVPDEDSYEQNVWPSVTNDEHCHSFTLYKERSWCPASRNLLEMVRQLPLVKVLRAEIIDQRPAGERAVTERYDYTLDGLICHVELVLQKLEPRFRLGSTLQQLTRCPACRRELTLVGHKDLVLHLRCQHCGSVSTCDMGQHG